LPLPPTPGLNPSTQPPLVSVIIPAYNAAPYLQATLDSVFAQTYPHYEIVLVNDGSPDTPALEAILDQLPPPQRARIQYLQQPNRGLAGARNTGLRAASGALVALLDADDLWLPNYLQHQTDFLLAHPELDLVYCNATFFGDSVFDGQDYMSVCPSIGDPTPAALIQRTCHVFVSVTARRDPLLAIGFDESLRSCEDYDCWLRFTAAGHRIGYHRQILVRYRKHPASLSANPTWMAEHNLRVLTSALVLWPPDSEEVRLLHLARLKKQAELDSLRAKLALRQRDIPAAITHLQAANRYYRTQNLHYQSAKTAATITLLRLAPTPVLATLKLRSTLFRAYRDS
jgi:glycosyltransferase involved in cell wall biosynthesis